MTGEPADNGRGVLPLVAVHLALVCTADGLDAWRATAWSLAANDNAPAAARLRALKRLRRGA